MKILFVGSVREFDESDDRLKDQALILDSDFVAFAKALGAATAARRHTLVVGTDRPFRLDPYVVEGALESPSDDVEIVVCRPDDGKRPFQAIHQTTASVRFTYRPAAAKNWSVSRVYQLVAADCVILVGGGDSALAAGLMAAALEKPVVAVPDFGGAGSQVCEMMWPIYEKLGTPLPFRRADASGPSFSPQHHANDVRTEGYRAYAEATLDLAQALVARNPFRAPRPWSLLFASIALFVLMTSWFCWFGWAPTRCLDISLFILLAVAAFLGTTLRATLRLINDEPHFVTINRVVTEGMVGLLLAFAFTLTYLAAGTLVYGNFTTSDDRETFRRAAISTSIMAFAVAFLLEEATVKLRTVLNSRLTNGLND